MPARGRAQLRSTSRLAQVRVARGLTQAELASRVGLSIATYQRLEEGRIDNPPIRYLTNLAIALDVDSISRISEKAWPGLTGRR